jgi:hypothetical protein
MNAIEKQLIALCSYQDTLTDSNVKGFVNNAKAAKLQRDILRGSIVKQYGLLLEAVEKVHEADTLYDEWIKNPSDKVKKFQAFETASDEAIRLISTVMVMLSEKSK